MSFKEQLATIKDTLLHPYSFSIRNEDNLAEEARFSFNLAALLGGFFIFILLLGAGVFFLVSELGQSEFRQTSITLQNRKKLIELIQRTDSLNEELQAYSIYYSNLEDIFSNGTGIYPGGMAENVDSVKLSLDDSALDFISQEELALRREFEGQEGNDILTVNTNHTPDISKMLLYKPAEGILSSSFRPLDGHYGVDIVAKKNEAVKSIAKGTVVLATWTEDGGNVISIQHPNNLISVYKHNSSLTKSMGDHVAGGEIIAIMGNSGELTTGPHLHFELWHEGRPIDPAQFITF